MDPGPQNQHDDVFFDAFHHCPFHHCSAVADNSPESSATASDPPIPSPASTIRRRSIRRRSPAKQSTHTDSFSDSIDTATTSLQNDPNLSILKENENSPKKIDSDEAKIRSFEEGNEESTITTASHDEGPGDSADSVAAETGGSPEKIDSDEEKLRSIPPPSVVTEERNEESTITTASHDDEGPGDSADSVAADHGDSPSSSLEFVAGLVIRVIMMQIKVFIFFVKSPVLLLFHGCMFFVDPFGTIRKGKSFFMEILDRVWGCVSAQGLFSEQNSFWNVAFRCGWGFLWSIYVCCILFGLLGSSVVVSGFVMKYLVEKPLQMKQVLNFDFTKQSPVAFVPVISCAGVGGGDDPENDLAVGKWMSRRVIPPKQKVQVTVALLVPESEYNTHLGIFQVRVDFLSYEGKTIASSSQPCMLKFRSEPIRLITTFLKIVPLVTGYGSETQTLKAKMRGFVEGDIPTSCLKVTLEQRAEYLPGAGIPQMYDSSIIVESELPFFKRIIWHWKMSIFIWITMMAFMMELLFVLVCCWPIIIPRTRQRSGSARGDGTQNNLQPPS
ncbi:seipin-2 [Lotus japonicus]|uniref:seipin-2 n=1 Tax=Lotus japonicus TaxID=34305 RepID=UPI00258B6790|nr:seipin-2 [Lotus japonicus]